MIPFKEDFKPSPQYKPYLAIYTIAATIVAILFAFGFGIIPLAFATGQLVIILAIVIIPLALLVAFVLVWVHLYYKSIVYNLNETEMTWKRGVWFRKTGIVPYNRITNIDISQGPVMRLFSISNLQIQTAGSSGNKAMSEISIIGMEDAEPLRAFIMDFVRGTPPVSAVTGSGETEPARTGSLKTEASGAEMTKLIEEVAAIRKLLEEKKE